MPESEKGCSALGLRNYHFPKSISRKSVTYFDHLPPTPHQIQRTFKNNLEIHPSPHVTGEKKEAPGC